MMVVLLLSMLHLCWAAWKEPDMLLQSGIRTGGVRVPDLGDGNNYVKFVVGNNGCSTANVVPRFTERCITAGSRIDGFGAQYEYVLEAMTAAASKGLDYCHSEFATMAHWVNITECNAAIGLAAGNSCYRCGIYPNFVSKTRHNIARTILQNWNPCIKTQIREALFKGMKSLGVKPIDHPRDHINVGVHIRRGDVTPAKPRFVYMATFIEIMNEVRRQLRSEGKKFLFHVYSEGDPADFAELAGQTDVVLHIDKAVGMLSDFISLVKSDILIMSPSTFSYVSSLLMNGQALFPRTHTGIYNVHFSPMDPSEAMWFITDKRLNSSVSSLN
eukprot:jgi/Bigna1/143532/aug1.79_g18240